MITDPFFAHGPLGKGNLGALGLSLKLGVGLDDLIHVNFLEVVEGVGGNLLAQACPFSTLIFNIGRAANLVSFLAAECVLRHLTALEVCFAARLTRHGLGKFGEDVFVATLALHNFREYVLHAANLEVLHQTSFHLLLFFARH